MTISRAIGGLLREIDSSPALKLLPLTVDVAAQVAALGPGLRDPAERAIVAHELRLNTSDLRIIASNLVATVV